MSEIWLQHLSSVVKNDHSLAYVWDADSDHFEWVGDFKSILGYEEGDSPENNNDFHKLLNPQDIPNRLTALHELLGAESGSEAGFSQSYKIKCANGKFIEVDESAVVQTDRASGKKKVCGHLTLAQGSAINGSSPNSAGNVVSTDIDSGFANYGRRAMQHKIEEWYDVGSKELGSMYGYVLAVGIDRMSIFNDVIGARYADELIEKIGKRLREIVAESGVVMRVDGDVFGVFFRQAPHNEMAAVANYILGNFCSIPIQTSVGPIGVGISIGGVALNRSYDHIAVLSMAEMAMNAAKEKGRNCFVPYEEASQNAESNRMLLKSADTFIKAMKGNRLRLAFQPIIASQNQSVSFHESLMRLIDEDGKLIPAGMFMPAIEKLGLARLVDQHALKMAIHELDMFPDLQLSVNVSNLSLNNHDWLRGLVSALRDRPSVAKRLIVEITETAVMHDCETSKRVISTMRDLGCRVALDDFGAGYTAFSQLKDLNVDIVKIDKSFIRNLGEEHNHLFVQTLRNLANGVNIETVGEGAETMAEANLLTADGIDYIQGYVYGFPQVERVWLPKGHKHRAMSDINIAPNSVDELNEAVEEDIDIWQKQGSF